MILYPAIDLKNGQCVRLLRGDLEAETVYDSDPAARAKRFQGDGFPWLHVVDLNGAVAGHAVNADAVAAIRAAVGMKLQLGGGIRDMVAVERWIAAGIDRLVLGTAAVRNPMLVKEAARAFPGQIAVGIDARGGYVAVSGWTEATEITATDLALAMQEAGAAAIIYTDIDRDGALTGVNVAATAALAQAVDIPVIASGGVKGLEDLEELLHYADHGIAGVIAGRAIYDGRLDPQAALALLTQAA